ncbi:hypothetical protein LTR47_010163 [Exophiala xenobiotica]|nr:hypothetical protein LTR47_010163 [Exophiala xenobiotica]KAK5251358.1 hypothetical protein LTS06_003919 [Exophiala xenobiotica]KAK5344975.1 hypothetical protein LTR61_011267 [Exophiala xenobiotica]KAK5360468.1 hypothetical protein LTS03_010629 [Exophiala xenobiotica]KAK5364762.1 hypothetical protein LTR11_008902 [Exophiala xenobiotica]
MTPFGWCSHKIGITYSNLLKQDVVNGTSTNAKNKGKHITQQAQGSSHNNGVYRRGQIKTISVSGIHSGDVGIFVTCDKGQEKRCLQEMSNILGDYIGQDIQPSEEAAQQDQGEAKGGDIDIEADILAELDSLRPNPSSNAPSQKLSFVTLDIPCVSFIRFPSSSETKTAPDPVDIVRKICNSASQRDYTGPRSRYVKRLTPVSLVRKVLASGLESLCDEVLPAHFKVQSDDPNAAIDQPAVQVCKFAIRPTIRNNNKLDRDQVIKVVADKVTALGNGKHTVDLKGYDKLILVDVYRNIVGMSVVGNEFESLKRFNLAEIHALHLDEDKKPEDEGVES